ncbi:MAG: LytTR family transcriptional regulator [Clostridia bacterium]|nr:LytTR family transcriptional regulator [Clostridia bacterium]
MVIEIDPDKEEEIRVRAKEMTPAIRTLGDRLGALLSGEPEIAVRDGDRERFLSPREILYAETADGRVYVHTANRVFSASIRLYELEELLPRYFVRAGKSVIANAMHISSLRRAPTGLGEAEFRGSDKKVFISRQYFKPVRDLIEEMRLKR